MKDEDVEGLLIAVRNGNHSAKEDLFDWAYWTGHHYYQMKVVSEKLLTPEDAEDLTSDFFLEFERALPRLRSATGFTRHVLKQNLKRYLRRKRRRQIKEKLLSHTEMNRKSRDSMVEQQTHVWEVWSDEEFLQYQAVLQVLRETDEATKQIMQLRLQDPPMQFNRIAERMKISETAARMRATRFYGLVRQKYRKVVLH